jgi:DUF971 family protein
MTPTAINVRIQSKLLEVDFADASYALPFELLRVYSPSAEVRGHGEGQEVLLTGKRHVSITAVQPVGNYAIQPHFTDGHNTGIFSWDYLHWLGANQTRLWQQYLEKLQQAGFPDESGRDVDMIIATNAGTKGCSS